MTDVKLVDVSLRDGNQSIWSATGVRTSTVASMAPLLDRVGYRAVELLTSTQIAVAVRFHREDPWERIDTAARAVRDTPLGFLTTGKRFVSFSRTPRAVFELAFELLRRHGVTRLWVVDPMHDMAGAMDTAAMAKAAGFDEVVAGVTYTNSPVHTDDYYADRVAQLDGCRDVDSVYVKDPAGLLTPERIATLVPHMQARLERLRIDEVHSHCNTGLAPLTLLRAADLGMSTLHCALPPVANGSSHPSALQLVKNLHARGHHTDVDVDAMEAASAALTREAKRRGLPAGAPLEYDEAYYQHTIPGGVVSTLRRHLQELGRVELLPAVIEEAIHVRRDLGWPIVMTPFAQYIVTQATLNVMSGERYSRLTDEVVDLLAGAFGPLPGEVDPDLLDRAMAHRNGELDDPDELTRADLRRQHGQHISDEELLLRAVMPTGQVDAMRDAAGGEQAALRRLVDQLEGLKEPMSVSVHHGGAHLSISTRGDSGAQHG